MSFLQIAKDELAELIRELTLSYESCNKLREEMREAALETENLVHLDALIWLPPFVSFWVEGNSPLLKFNPRTGKYEPFGSHL
jgi:hypothetical protein